MKNKTLFAVCLLTGLMFINSGLNKFFFYMPIPKDLPENMLNLMRAFMNIGWIMPLIGFVEIVGGILFITSRFRALGALIIFPIIIGILLTHILDSPSGIPIAIILLAIEIWVIYENREKYLPLIK
ncbi:MAG: DoxX family membrane protein [Bacteroidetes bacterium]|nr:DoxX family membrane protein [Bacteroidota bacterium]